MRDQEGFTLIELMVVVLVIGILIAIALPVFNGARARAEDRATQTNLRTAIIAAETYYAQSASYTGFDSAGNPQAAEASIVWVYPSAAATQGTVTVNYAAGDSVILSSLSRSGQVFCIAASAPSGGNLYKGTVDGNGLTNPTQCVGGW